MRGNGPEQPVCDSDAVGLVTRLGTGCQRRPFPRQSLLNTLEPITDLVCVADAALPRAAIGAAGLPCIARWQAPRAPAYPVLTRSFFVTRLHRRPNPTSNLIHACGLTHFGKDGPGPQLTLVVQLANQDLAESRVAHSDDSTRSRYRRRALEGLSLVYKLSAAVGQQPRKRGPFGLYGQHIPATNPVGQRGQLNQPSGHHATHFAVECVGSKNPTLCGHNQIPCVKQANPTCRGHRLGGGTVYDHIIPVGSGASRSIETKGTSVVPAGSPSEKTWPQTGPVASSRIGSDKATVALSMGLSDLSLYAMLAAQTRFRNPKVPGPEAREFGMLETRPGPWYRGPGHGEPLMRIA